MGQRIPEKEIANFQFVGHSTAICFSPIVVQSVKVPTLIGFYKKSMDFSMPEIRLKQAFQPFWHNEQTPLQSDSAAGFRALYRGIR